MRRLFKLSHRMARERAIECIMDSPTGFEVIVREPTRGNDASAAFHALCGDLEKAKIPWAGEPRTAEAWKVILVSGHTKATGGETEIVTGLEGELVSIRESTATMSKARMSSLIEYTNHIRAVLEASNEDQDV